MSFPDESIEAKLRNIFIEPISIGHVYGYGKDGKHGNITEERIRKIRREKFLKTVEVIFLNNPPDERNLLFELTFAIINDYGYGELFEDIKRIRSEVLKNHFLERRDTKNLSDNIPPYQTAIKKDKLKSKENNQQKKFWSMDNPVIYFIILFILLILQQIANHWGKFVQIIHDHHF